MSSVKIPKTIQEAEKVFAKYLKDFSDYKIGEELTNNIDIKTKLCKDKKTNEALKLVTYKSTSAINSDLEYQFYTICQAAATCSCPFLMPLQGIVRNKQLTYVTNYYPYGTIHDILFRSKKIKLSGTHKTCIAMCIAYGAMKLHEKGFFHRKLNNECIYLNDGRLPVICDFDLVNSEEKTNESPRYQAPEIIFDKEFNQKADVYSFGLLLYELSEEVIAFKDYTDTQIRSLISSEQRPQFTTKTPQKLATVIQKCWAQNPQHRPSFKAIYEKFTESAVEFPDTDSGIVKQLAIGIVNKVSDLCFEDSGTGEGKFVGCGNLKILREIGHKSIDFDYGILTNPHHSKLIPYINTLFDNVCPDDYISLYDILIKNFETASADAIYAILSGFINLCNRDKSFLNLIISQGFFKDPPMISPKSIQYVMNLFVLMITNSIKDFTKEYIPQIELFIALNPHESIALMQTYLVNGGTNLEILHLLLTNSSQYMNPNLISHYLSTVFAAMGIPEFSNAYRNEFLQVFLAALRSQDVCIVKYGYIALLNFVDPQIRFNPSTLLMHLQEPQLTDLVLHVMLEYKSIPSSKEFFETLLQFAASGNQLAICAMCEFVSESIDNVTIAASVNWIMHLQPMDSFKILLAAAKFNAAMPLLVAIPDIVTFIYTFYQQLSSRPDMYIAFIILLVSLPFSGEILRMNEFQNMYHELFIFSLYSANEEIKFAGINLLYATAKCGYIADYPSFVPILINMIKTQSNYTFTVIGILSEFAKYPDALEQMIQNQLVPYFQSLLQYPQYAEYAKNFFLYVK